MYIYIYIYVYMYICHSNRLKLNAIEGRSSNGLDRLVSLPGCTFDLMMISGVPIQPSSSMRDLDAYIDDGMMFDGWWWWCWCGHVLRPHPSAFRSIRRSLTVDSSHALVRAMIYMTRLDYCIRTPRWGADSASSVRISRILRAAARIWYMLLSPHQQYRYTIYRTRAMHWHGCTFEGNYIRVETLLAHRCIIMDWLRPTWSGTSYRSAQFQGGLSTTLERQRIHGVCAWIEEMKNRLDHGRSPWSS